MINDDFSWQEVGSRIRSFRTAQGMLQVELARRAELSQAAIARVELGAREPQLGTLRRIANALHVPIRQLVSGEADHLKHCDVHFDVNMILDSGNLEAIAAFNQGLHLAKCLVGRRRSAVLLARETRDAGDLLKKADSDGVTRTIAGANTPSFGLPVPRTVNRMDVDVAKDQSHKASVQGIRQECEQRSRTEENDPTVSRTIFE